LPLETTVLMTELARSGWEVDILRNRADGDKISLRGVAIGVAIDPCRDLKSAQLVELPSVIADNSDSSTIDYRGFS
jgi:hypothetical protein